MSEDTSTQVRRELRQAGLTIRAIDAAWPEWWSREAESSASATAELRYTLARRLGLSPASLFEGPPRFVWRDEAKFKRLTAADEAERAAISSFGMAFGRMLTSATPSPVGMIPGDGRRIRSAILNSSPFVRLSDILALCWSHGVPVVHAAVLPLKRKRMTAMAVSVKGRHAIILGSVSKFEAQLAYTIAHELGHIAIGHVLEIGAVVELGDALTDEERADDEEEVAADRFALALLTGTEDPTVIADNVDFTASQLAEAAQVTAMKQRISPGVLALCLGHATGRWAETFGALKILPPGEQPLPTQVNDIAIHEMDFDAVSSDTASYIRRVLAVSE